MQEFNWADQHNQAYWVYKGQRPWYGDFKNPKETLLICDREVRIHLRYAIGKSMNEFEQHLNLAEKDGYEFYHCKIERSDDNNGGCSLADVEIEFFRKENDEEKKKRLDSMLQLAIAEVERKKQDVIVAETKLKELKSKLQ